MCICEDCLNAAICDFAFSGDFPCQGIDEFEVENEEEE